MLDQLLFTVALPLPLPLLSWQYTYRRQLDELGMKFLGGRILWISDVEVVGGSTFNGRRRHFASR